MNKCSICPNDCKIDRDINFGACGQKNDVKIAKFYLHPFEEPIISGTNGSGTVFFSGCSLKCVFCQNFELSRSSRGKTFSAHELSQIFKTLEDMGAHNINLVNPTHYTNQIIDALKIYRPKIPICWNTHGYETIETLEKLNDFVDIYLTDLKYYSKLRALRYANKENYFEFASKAVKFMIEKKPSIIDDGLLKQGVIVRHLILPQNSDETANLLKWLRPVIKDAYLSLMAQYTPFGDIEKFDELKRPITKREYKCAKDLVEILGFEKVFLQEFSSSTKAYIPSWDF